MDIVAFVEKPFVRLERNFKGLEIVDGATLLSRADWIGQFGCRYAARRSINVDTIAIVLVLLMYRSINPFSVSMCFFPFHFCHTFNACK